MNIFEASKQLIEEEFIVFFCERLFALDDLSQVCIHHLGYHINILELFPRFGKDNCLNIDNILVLQQLEKSQLSESSFCKDLVLEGLVDLFDGHELVLVFGSHNNAICSLTD